jgi:signal transduction histidine kinase
VTRRLLVTYLTITAFALAVFVIPLGVTFAGREQDRLLFNIERDAEAVASRAQSSLQSGSTAQVDALLTSYRSTGGRIVIVDTKGRSVADSDHVGGKPQDFSNRPEMMTALGGSRASGVRSSETAHTDLLYVAIPVAANGVVQGAVRITYPNATLNAAVRSNWLRLAGLSGVVLLTVTAFGIVLARSVSRPVRQVQAAAHRMADGDLSLRVRTDQGPPELRDLAVTFNTMTERLAQLIDSQRRFIADASHQLRTPLTALRLRLENLAPRVAPEDRARVDAALDETTRLARLVTSLLVLARIDAATYEVVTVDVTEVVRERTETWNPVATDQGVQLRDACPAGIRARIIPGALEQILDNLISNALQVCPSGTSVTVSAARANGGIDVHVVDEGPGMTAEQRRHAFERFWRPPDAHGEGFGLGLAIVDQLATVSGGGARIVTAPDGVGTDVVVHLHEADPGPAAAPPVPTPVET